MKEIRKLPHNKEVVFSPDVKYPFAISFVKGNPKGGRYHLHISEIEMHYFKKAEGHYCINNDIYPIEPRTLMIIRKNELHRYIPLKERSFIHKITLYLTRSIFNELPSGIKKRIVDDLINCRENSPHLIKFSADEAAAVELIFDLIGREWANKEGDYRMIIVNNLINLFILIRRAISPKKELVERSGEPAFLKRLLDYVDENHMRPVALSDIAAELSYSPFYISHIIKTYTGFTFKEYLTGKRMQRAKELLEETDLKVIKICFDTGFASIDAFNREFKKMAKMTPTQYRKLCEVYRKEHGV